MIMPHKIISNFLTENPDVITIISIHIGAASVSLLDIEIGFKIFSLALASGYTIWRWYTQYKKDKHEDKS